MAGMESTLADQLLLTLTEFCITDAATNKADHVVIGRPDQEYRDDIVVSIYTEHPQGPEKAKDYLASGKAAGRWFWPSQTTGGGVMEAIVGVVQIDARGTRSAAEQLAILSDVTQRATTAINTDADLITLADDHGGTLIVIEVVESSGYDGTTGVVSASQRWVTFVAFISREYCRS